MKTKVIFRKFPDGEVIAIFPEESYDDIHSDLCMSYMQVGQHGACSKAIIHELSQPITSESEYIDLYKELESIGYELEVIRD